MYACQGSRASGQPLLADRAPANIADAVPAFVELVQRGVGRREMCACLIKQCRDMLPFECDRRPFGIVLVIAA